MALPLAQDRPKQEAPPTITDTLPLENGDHLTRFEFEQRYAQMPPTTRAELIEGNVHMSSPTHHAHSKAHAHILTWLGVYSAATPGVEVLDNATVRLDFDNVVQPDAALRIAAATGGRSSIASDDYLEGAPELVIEIAASSASYDLYDKKSVYRRSGVLETIVWRIHDQAIDWFTLDKGRYIAREPDATHTIESTVFPGLRLAVQAMLEHRLDAVLAELQRSISSDAHQAFVASLAERTSKEKG